MHTRLLTRSLRYRRGRHFLNAAIMAITVAIVVLFFSVLTKLATFSSQSSRGRVIVSPAMFQAGKNELPQTFATLFQQIEGVRDVQCQKILNTKPADVAYMISGEKRSGVEMNQDLLPVTPEVVEAWDRAKPMGAILTETASRELNLPIGKEGELPTAFGPLRIKVVGLSKGGLQTRRMALHLEYLQQFTGNDGTCLFRVFADPPKASQVANEIVERTRNTANPTQTMVDSEFAQTWVKNVAKVPTLLGFLGLFLALTTTLTLANSSAIAIRERRTEMAAMRVMGFLPRTITFVVLAEAILVGVIGGIIGIVGVYLVVGSDGFALSGAVQANVLGNVQITMPGVLAGLATAILVPLAGALPAIIASNRVPLVTALRDSA